jgi:hypothetical protein
MRGVSEATRAKLRDNHNDCASTREKQVRTITNGEAMYTRRKGKRRQTQHDIAKIDIALFAVANSHNLPFDRNRILNDNVNDRTEEEKDLFRREKSSIYGNWVPRPNVYPEAWIGTLRRAVLGGLILSEALIMDAYYYALHATFTYPLGSEWKTVNGYYGMLVAAKIL